MVSLAPNLDLFAEITQLATYFTSKYGEKFAQEIGVDLRQTPVDLLGVKESLGLDPSIDTLTYKELVERRELIRKRMEVGGRNRPTKKKLASTWKFARTIAGKKG